MPETAQEALARDIILAAEHQEAVRKVFRRERDRLAAKPDADPVRDAEWAAAIAALWVVAGEQVYPSTVTDINPGVEPGPAPDFGGFIQNAVEGIVRTSRRRIEALRLTKPLNLSRQLRKLYQVEFIQKRAPRIALDQALRQTASFEAAAAKKVEEATGVPSVVLGIKEGAEQATYNNYQSALSHMANFTTQHMWNDTVNVLTNGAPVPLNEKLIIDTTDIPALQQDGQDAATITETQGRTIRDLTDGGYTAESVIDAVTSNDLTLLVHDVVEPDPTSNGEVGDPEVLAFLSE